jgi:hypothetical protein
VARSAEVVSQYLGEMVESAGYRPREAL